MTCAQGLLRLLWGGPKLECYGTAQSKHLHSQIAQYGNRIEDICLVWTLPSTPGYAFGPGRGNMKSGIALRLPSTNIY